MTVPIAAMSGTVGRDETVRRERAASKERTHVKMTISCKVVDAQSGRELPEMELSRLPSPGDMIVLSNRNRAEVVSVDRPKELVSMGGEPKLVLRVNLA